MVYDTLRIKKRQFLDADGRPKQRSLSVEVLPSLNQLVYKILDSLTQNKIPPKLIRLIKLTLENTTGKVKVN